ncbi:OspC family protein (plasmid) [Shigella dysenteriae 1617]|uniref:OspC family protein n=1 Tax=Shigella dysenteriae 1617 TaxID=754093 RepID=A0A0A7A4W1_SHIDY|nr:OspC family protein [Shigella dysenteriae 1617]
MKIPEAVNHINVQNNIDLVDGKTKSAFNARLTGLISVSELKNN